MASCQSQRRSQSQNVWTMTAQVGPAFSPKNLSSNQKKASVCVKIPTWTFVSYQDSLACLTNSSKQGGRSPQSPGDLLAAGLVRLLLSLSLVKFLIPWSFALLVHYFSINSMNLSLVHAHTLLPMSTGTHAPLSTLYPAREVRSRPRLPCQKRQDRFPQLNRRRSRLLKYLTSSPPCRQAWSTFHRIHLQL
jgi:hypothetical protein